MPMSFGQLSHEWLLPPMMSYAQNFEDVMLRRALQDIEKGFYIDLGASHPIHDSCTCWFYEQGWRGLNAEPHPETYKLVCEHRPEDINIPAAVTNETGFSQLHMFGTAIGASTLHQDRKEAVIKTQSASSGTTSVITMRLDDIIKKYVGDKTIDFMKIDVEGSEKEIIDSTDFTCFRPRLILIEAQRVSTTTPPQIIADWPNWEPKLISQGYEFVWYDGLNRFYLRTEDIWRAKYFGVPPCPLDRYELPAHDRRISVYNSQSHKEKVLQERRELDEERLRLDTERLRLDAERQRLDKERIRLQAIATSQAAM